MWIEGNAGRVTSEDLERGFVVCGCGKFAHVMKAEVLRKLPRDYHGELCAQCQCWMCSVEKLREAGFEVDG